MKKLIMCFVSVLLTTGLMAQADQKTATTTTVAKPTPHSCYVLKNDTLMHCMGDKMEIQNTTVTLREGTQLNTRGQVTRAINGSQPFMLSNGQCVNMMGAIGNYSKMHPAKIEEVK